MSYDFDNIGSCADIFNLAHGLSAIANVIPLRICLMGMAIFPKSGPKLNAKKSWNTLTAQPAVPQKASGARRI